MSRLLFGGKLGLLQEVKKSTTRDMFSYEELYINEQLISDKAHFNVGIKSYNFHCILVDNWSRCIFYGLV